MLWSGLVPRVGASQRANLIAPFPAWTDLPKENEYQYSIVKTLLLVLKLPYFTLPYLMILLLVFQISLCSPVQESPMIPMFTSFCSISLLRQSSALAQEGNSFFFSP